MQQRNPSMHIENGGFFSVNKHFISRQAPTAGGICNSVNVSGSQGRPVTGLSVLEADNPATKIFNNS